MASIMTDVGEIVLLNLNEIGAKVTSKRSSTLTVSFEANRAIASATNFLVYHGDSTYRTINIINGSTIRYVNGSLAEYIAKTPSSETVKNSASGGGANVMAFILFIEYDGIVYLDIAFVRTNETTSYAYIDISEATQARFEEFLRGAAPPEPPTDPFAPGGEITDKQGGEGDFDGTSVDIEVPELPDVSASSAGFISLFNPSVSDLRNLASYMWSDLFDIDGWKKLFADPMQAILGMSIVPVSPAIGGSKEVQVGNIGTGVSMPYISNQYVTVDCGTINVKEYWGAYLDYAPYTKAQIYLPYIGMKEVSIDDIMNKSVHVIYHVDVLSGACCAYVSCNGTVLYSYIGQCASSVPITGDNYTNVINGVLNAASAVVPAIAMGGLSPLGAAAGAASVASAAANMMKPNVERSGSFGSTGGLLGVQTPYLILTRPKQALASGQNGFTGYPSFITSKLGDLTGYTEVYAIHLETIPATEPELKEIDMLLKEGVLI